MDDTCAVCAEVLEWVGYGACGHRDVCSTCVARLRFICNDRHCCICKTEGSIVFVTKALGDYTRMINDFSVLPSEPKEGRNGSYWYHEYTQAFFDDSDHYNMIKAMCRLSCSVCDKEEPNDGSKRRGKFRNIRQLQGHLRNQHELQMCELCLEGRKVFICEQKLYNRAQLNQHIRTGDSEVDGSESERGGFMGHPSCEFCRRKPFYSDNELYSHMSTEHYTCHICQRQHPGQYEYYRDYNDLEIHFRRDHFLCEDEGCLQKKFVVFQTEAEMKRHYTIEHGGHMSRAKRNAALQIPTSFRYRRSNEQDNRRERGRTVRRDQSDNQLSLAIQVSLETAYSESTSNGQSSSGQLTSDNGNSNDIDIDPLVQPFESLTTTDPETSSRYLEALGHSSRIAPLPESFFPPLSMAPSSDQQKAKDESEGLPNKTMAAHLRRQNRNATVSNSPQWPAAGRGRISSSSALHRPTVHVSLTNSSNSASGPPLSSYASSIQGQVQPRLTAVQGQISAGSSGNSGNPSRISHSSSAPNLSSSRPLKPSISDFPPVSSVQVHKMASSSHGLPNFADVHIANKSLVENIRAALENNEDLYGFFRDVSAQYRQGSIDAGEYLGYVQQFGLSHLVLELARLCPDAQKQKQLIETHNTGLRGNGQQENGGGSGSAHLKGTDRSKKGKGIVVEDSSSKDRLADSFINTVRALQSNHKPVEEEIQLSRDGYRAAKGKSNAMVDEQQVEPGVQNDYLSAGDGSNKNLKDESSGKHRKKNSKFHRVRLGDGSMASLLDLNNSDPDPDPNHNPNTVDNRLDDNKNPTGGLPVRGVWRKGGGQKLFP